MLAFKKLLTESKSEILPCTDDTVPTGPSQDPNLGFQRPGRIKRLVGSIP